jgi:DNA-binding transcriptional LysR family regulator
LLDGIEALIALEQFATVSEAATRLRLTQSAVSKRIQALQAAVGFPLVERDGRRLRLTPQATRFLERARPLVAELRGLAVAAPERSLSRFSLALADSIASSWGPRVVAEAQRRLPDVAVELHSHRSVLLVESIRLGRYNLGLCTTVAPTRDLVEFPLMDEPLVLVAAAGARKLDARLPLVCVESSSATWRAVAPLLRAHHPKLLRTRRLEVESFGAALQMVRAGFGNGLVPLGLAVELGVPRAAMRALGGVVRRVSLVTRKSLTQLEGFARFRAVLEEAAAEHRAFLRRARIGS